MSLFTGREMQSLNSHIITKDPRKTEHNQILYILQAELQRSSKNTKHDSDTKVDIQMCGIE